MPKIIKKINLNNVLLTICLLAVNGGVIYFFWALNNISLAIIFILTAGQLIMLNYYIGLPEYYKFNRLTGNFFYKWPDKIAFLIYWLLLLGLFYLLLLARTGKSLVSPWLAVSHKFFIFFLAATFILFYLGQKNAGKKYFLFLVIGYSLLAFNIATIVYQLGYGFDPFVHQATVRLILEKGLVQPKTPYYLGQYSLEFILSKITRLPLNWLDKLLLPVFAAIFLPWELKRWFKKTTNKNLAVLALLLAFIFPFSFLIVTTPQNLAYVFLLLAIIRSLTINNTFDLILISALALAALVTQPIAGIPAIIFSALIWLNQLSLKAKTKKYLSLVLFFSAVVCLPLIFVYLAKTPNWKSLVFFWPKINFNFFQPARFYPWLNLVYFWGKNFNLFYLAIILAGWFVAARKKIIPLPKIKIYLGLALALAFSYFFTARLRFDFLINYEQLNYANRLLVVAAFFAWPLALALLAEFACAWQKQNRFNQLVWLVFLAGLITANLYLSYPRQDPYFNSRSYSTSIYDQQAVRWIENQANQDYIVLANQQVSAAALREFGFKKYYQMPTIGTSSSAIVNNSLFFYYPVPTGGPLYPYYLKMIYKKPSRRTMRSACDLAAVKQGYLVVNKYWWAFDKIVKEAKLEADSWAKFGSEDVYVFKYKF